MTAKTGTFPSFEDLLNFPGYLLSNSSLPSAAMTIYEMEYGPLLYGPHVVLQLKIHYLNKNVFPLLQFFAGKSHVFTHNMMQINARLACLASPCSFICCLFKIATSSMRWSREMQ